MTHPHTLTRCVALVVGAVLLGASADAQIVGRLAIKGKRYVDGEEMRISCKGSTQTNTIEWSVASERVITLDPFCPLTADFTSLTFVGRESEVTRNGISKRRFLFTGVVGSDVPPADPALRGGLSGELRFNQTMPTITYVSDKGTIFYNYRTVGDEQVQFIGSYTARCDDDLGVCGP